MLTAILVIDSIASLQFQRVRVRDGASPPVNAPGQMGPARSMLSERTELEEQMSDLIRRTLSRREAMRISALGAGAMAVAAAGRGRFLLDRALAQDATPASGFDPATCYT